MVSPCERQPWYRADFDLRIEDPRLLAIYRHWESLRSGAGPPDVERFDPLDLVPHMGDLFVVRVEHGAEGTEPELRYTLIGTRLVEALGRDTTGQLVRDTFPPEHPVNAVYRRLLAEQVAVRTYGRLDWVNKDFKSFESVLLPLVRSGGRVEKIIGAAVYRRFDGPVVGDGAAS